MVQALAPTYTYGLTEALDAYASLPYQSLRGDSSRARGWSNAALGGKWRFHEDPARGTSLALKPELLLPVSPVREAAGLGAGKVSAQLTAILSQEMPFGALHANLGWGRERSRNAADQATLQRVSIAPVWSLSDALSSPPIWAWNTARPAGRACAPASWSWAPSTAPARTWTSLWGPCAPRTTPRRAARAPRSPPA